MLFLSHSVGPKCVTRPARFKARGGMGALVPGDTQIGKQTLETSCHVSSLFFLLLLSGTIFGQMLDPLMFLSFFFSSFLFHFPHLCLFVLLGRLLKVCLPIMFLFSKIFFFFLVIFLSLSLFFFFGILSLCRRYKNLVLSLWGYSFIVFRGGLHRFLVLSVTFRFLLIILRSLPYVGGFPQMCSCPWLCVCSQDWAKWVWSCVCFGWRSTCELPCKVMIG